MDSIAIKQMRIDELRAKINKNIDTVKIKEKRDKQQYRIDLKKSRKDMKLLKLQQANPGLVAYIAKPTDTVLYMQNGSVVFENGYVSNIQINALDKNNKPYVFQNIYPIPLQSQWDIEALKYIKLYEKHSKNLYVRLVEVFDYNKEVDLARRDYSPQDTVIELSFNDTVNKFDVHKEPGFRFFNIAVFSDLVGIGEENPNGLVQTEISRKFNLVSRRLQWSKKGLNFSGLNFITPMLTTSKIENKQKYLISEMLFDSTTFVNDSTSLLPLDEKLNTYSRRTITTLQLYRYQVFSVGFNLNIVTVDAPNFKSTFYLNSGLYYGRTLVRDSLMDYNATDTTFSANGLVNNIGINTIQFQPTFTWQIFGDGRAGLSLSNSIILFKAFTDKYNIAGNTRDIKNDNGTYNFGKQNLMINSFEFFGWFKPSKRDYGKLFLRYRFNSELGFGNAPKHNFHQLQLGYSLTFDPIKIFSK